MYKQLQQNTIKRSMACLRHDCVKIPDYIKKGSGLTLTTVTINNTKIILISSWYYRVGTCINVTKILHYVSVHRSDRL